PQKLSPNRHGECGSPSRAEYAWWRRWSATHWVGLPSTAVLPATVSAIRSPRFALNDPCVRYRWKPVPMPKPPMRYIAPPSATSSQVSPQPQATGTATSTAANGMVTNAQSAIRMPGPCRPSVRGLGAGSRSVADMAPRWDLVGYAYVTVTYGGVGLPDLACVKSFMARRGPGMMM